MYNKILSKTLHFLVNEHMRVGLEHLQAFSSNQKKCRELYRLAKSLQATAIKFLNLILDKPNHKF